MKDFTKVRLSDVFFLSRNLFTSGTTSYYSKRSLTLELNEE